MDKMDFEYLAKFTNILGRLKLIQQNEVQYIV